MSGRPLALDALISHCREKYQGDYKYSEAIDIAADADAIEPLIAMQLLAEVYAAWYHHLITREYRMLGKISHQDHLRLACEAEKYRQLADEIWHRNDGLRTAWENHDEKSAEIVEKIQRALTPEAKNKIETAVQAQLELLFPGDEIVVITPLDQPERASGCRM
mgnify:CR=1 FL=1